MKLKKIVSAVALASLATFGMTAQAADKVYADFPVTVKNYTGNTEHSVAYTGQIARHVLHTSLKKLAGKGTGEANAELKAQMMAYYEGKDAGRDILSPASKGKFVFAESTVDELSKKKNLAGKAYKGAVTSWPGNMTGAEVLSFMIDKAATAEKGYDSVNGLDYAQLISKFTMGAVFYNQAVDSYLDEKLEADTKPNNKAYEDGKPYTGKEHVWDEAFGYFGAPAHTLTLSAKDVYNIAKGNEDALTLADTNKDGKVSLYNEMAFAHAYYAAGFDKGGKTNYLHTITEAFIDGRQLIADANGEKLTDEQRTKLKGYAAVIAENWEKVIAEAVFKYAGSAYKDIEKLNAALESKGDVSKVLRGYGKHWGELKGFAMALQVSGKDLGATGVQLNRLIGFGPVLLGNTQVTGIDADGNFVQSSTMSLDEYALNMLKVQQLMVDEFGVEARNKDVLASMGDLIKKLGEQAAEAEND
ncbi:DUF4856 domain-containing protein [Pontibacterium granulatum]|uniref:DUF4856 domain-containing protein n=1 Tax=Pontibacterium granulatum TaxID=2036029 RepID=UPI002499FFC0|nr:DUF4856 domain-containing protein [Pontibacterium granulatum]MDI3325994.1 DUF4856 domain-containing protein [Pontibacterium granulatum]